MSKAPSLISGCNGKPEAYKASKQVSCAKCDRIILKDQNAIKIPTKTGSYLKKKYTTLGSQNELSADKLLYQICTRLTLKNPILTRFFNGVENAK